jgi:MFS family permease
VTRGVDSGYAWFRLSISLAMMTLGASGMYAIVVALPEVQQEFGVARGDASMPYMLALAGFGLGGVLMGRLSDRYGVFPPVVLGAFMLCAGFVAAAFAPNLLVFAIIHGVLIGLLGSAASFSPLIADISFWFLRRRGIAVALCASGNYLGGTVWPPIVQMLIGAVGWREAYLWIGVGCLITMLPLALLLRAPRPTAGATAIATPAAAAQVLAGTGSAARASAPAAPLADAGEQALGMPARSLLALLCVAGVACCVAMTMPQVHIVAYCVDLGYGPARGAEMMSLMFGFGIVSRLIYGVICDRIGGLRTLLLSSSLQAVALALFIPYDSLVSLYVVSILFGLFQGGIVPSYAIVVREYFAPALAGVRVGMVLTSTLIGMAFGGWLTGVIFDLTGSYDAAFFNGIVWNLANIAIVLWLLRRARRMGLLRPAFA